MITESKHGQLISQLLNIMTNPYSHNSPVFSRFSSFGVLVFPQNHNICTRHSKIYLKNKRRVTTVLLQHNSSVVSIRKHLRGIKTNHRMTST